METSEPGTQPQTWKGTEYILFNECLVFPLQIPAQTHGETKSFHLWLSFFLLTVWVSLWAGMRHFFLCFRTRLLDGQHTLETALWILWSTQENRTGTPSFSRSQRHLIPHPGVPHLASLISPDGFAETHCMFSLSPDSRISSSLVVTVVGWRGRDTRSPTTISHYFNIESFGHTAQCPQAGGSVGSQYSRS